LCINLPGSHWFSAFLLSYLGRMGLGGLGFSGRAGDDDAWWWWIWCAHLCENFWDFCEDLFKELNFVIQSQNTVYYYYVKPANNVRFLCSRIWSFFWRNFFKETGVILLGSPGLQRANPNPGLCTILEWEMGVYPHQFAVVVSVRGVFGRVVPWRWRASWCVLECATTGIGKQRFRCGHSICRIAHRQSCPVLTGK